MGAIAVLNIGLWKAGTEDLLTASELDAAITTALSRNGHTLRYATAVYEPSGADDREPFVALVFDQPAAYQNGIRFGGSHGVGVDLCRLLSQNAVALAFVDNSKLIAGWLIDGRGVCNHRAFKKGLFTIPEGLLALFESGRKGHLESSLLGHTSPEAKAGQTIAKGCVLDAHPFDALSALVRDARRKHDEAVACRDACRAAFDAKMAGLNANVDDAKQELQSVTSQYDDYCNRVWL